MNYIKIKNAIKLKKERAVQKVPMGTLVLGGGCGRISRGRLLYTRLLSAHMALSTSDCLKEDLLFSPQSEIEMIQTI